MSSTERGAGESTRDDKANSSSAAGRTKTIDRAREDEELTGTDDEQPADVAPSIDPLLPPVSLSAENGNGNGHAESAVEPHTTDSSESGREVAAPVKTKPRTKRGAAKATARTSDPSADKPSARPPEPAPAASDDRTALLEPPPAPIPPPQPVVHVAPSTELADVSNPMPIVTRRATVVGAERHLVAPVHRAIGRRPRVRKVTRVVRHVDPWTVFKVAAIFSMVVYGVLLTAGVLLWNVANTTGTVDNIERFFESFGWEQFEFNGGQIYHAAWIAGLFGAVALTGFAVLGATLFNLITDLVGGVRFTVLEEEVVEKTASPMRRFTVRRTETDPTPAGGATVDQQR